MGLAAAQVRYMMLTARLNDVEGRLMENSNERLALSRQSAQDSETYSNALNATKVVYGTSDGNTDLSYSMFNSPTSDYVLTNNSGAVVLSTAQATSWGLSQGTAVNESGRSAFLQAAAGVDAATANAYIANPTTKPSTTVTDAVFTTNYSDAAVFEYLADEIGVCDGAASSSTQLTNKNTWESIYYNETGASSMVVFNQWNEDGSEPTEKNQQLLKSLVTGICEDSGAAVTAVLVAQKKGYDADDLAAIVAVATEKTQAFYKAQMSNPQELAISSSIWGENAAIEAAGGTNQVISNNDGSGTEWSVDTSQIVKTFLTYFDQECANYAPVPENALSYVNGSISSATTLGSGAGSGASLGLAKIGMSAGLGITTGLALGSFFGSSSSSSSSSTSLAVTTRGTTGGTASEGVVTSDGSTTTTTGSSTLEYYYNLFTEILNNSFTVNDQVSDSEYLEDQVSYGTLVIRDSSSWTTETVDDAASDFVTVSDTEEITQAEADYQAKKDKTDYKEALLDVEQTNLDTERAEITTEMESVQKIIDSNVKKFSMFQANG